MSCWRFFMRYIIFYINVFFILTLLSTCRFTDQPVGKHDYQGALIGHWQGTLSDYYKENINFRKNKTYESQLQSGGFIGNTMSQGIHKVAAGTWNLAGDSLLLTTGKATTDTLFMKSGLYKIVSLSGNELKIRNSKGNISVFKRIHGM